MNADRRTAKPSARTPPQRPHPVIRWIRGGVGLALFLILLRLVPLKEVGRSLMAVYPAPLLLGFVVMFLGLLLLAAKLQVLLGTAGPRVRFRRVFRAYYIGTFFNNFLPTTVGGDLMKVRELRAEGMPGGHTTAAVLVERATGALAVLALLFLVALFGGHFFPRLRLRVFRWPALLGSLLVLLVFFWSYAYGLPRIRNFLAPRSDSRLLSPFYRAAESFYVFRENWAALSTAVVIAAVYYVLVALTMVLVSQSLSATISLPVALGILPFVKVVEMLPVTVGGLGLREGAITYCLIGFGFQPAQAASVALVLRFLYWAHSAAGGLIYSFSGRRPVPQRVPADPNDADP